MRDAALQDRQLFLSVTIDTSIVGRIDIRNLLHCLCIQLLSMRPSLWAACHPFWGAIEAFTTVAPPEEYLWRCLNALLLSSEDAIVCVLDLVHAQFEQEVIHSILARLSSILEIGKASVKFTILLGAKYDFSSTPAIMIDLPGGNWDLMNRQMVEFWVKFLLKKRPEMGIVETDITAGCNSLLHDWSLVDSFLSSLETLPQASIQSIKSLAKLFQQPDECFQYIFGGVPERERSWIQIALVWLVFSVRPLSPRELGTVVLATISSLQDRHKEAKQPDFGPKISVAKTSLSPEAVAFDMCRFLPALVEVVHDKVRLINPHVRAFLEPRNMANSGASATGEQWYRAQHPHLVIAESSLLYLYQCSFPGPDSPRDIAQTQQRRDMQGAVRLGTREEIRVLIEYAVKHWESHLRKHEALSSHVSETLAQLLGDCKLMMSWSCWKHSLGSAESKRLPEAALQSPFEISRSYRIPLSTAVQVFDTAFLAQFNSDWKLDVKTLLALQLKNGVELMQHISKACEGAKNTQHIVFTIFRAVQLGVASFDTAKRMLEDSILLDDASGILSLEISRGKHEAMQYLFSKDPKGFVDIINENITTLHKTCLYGYPQLVQWLCDNTRVPGLSWVNQQDSGGYTPLHIATEQGHFDIVKMLVEHGADLNGRGPSLLNPLSIAAKKGFTQIAKYFLAKGVSCHATDDSERTSLHHASVGGSVEITRALLANGAIWSQADCNKDNALHLAIRSCRRDVSLFLLNAIQQSNQSDRDAIQPAGLNCPGSDEKTPLHAAIDADLEEIVLAIVKVHVSLGVEKHRGILTLAASRGLGKLVDQLLAAGLDPNERGENGNFPLDVAASQGAGNVVEILLKHQKHRGVTNMTAMASALRKAAVSGHLEISKRLLGLTKGQYDIGTLDDVVVNGHTEVAMVLLKDGHSNLPTELGRVLLSCAQFKQKEILDFLLENKVDKDFQDENGNTALQIAAAWDKPEIVKSLLNQQAAMELKDVYGYTALLYACRNQSLASLEILLKAGADIEARTNVRKTPLHLSTVHENIECFRVLLEWGAQPAPTRSWSGHSTFLEHLVHTKDAGWVKMLFEKTQGKQSVRQLPGFQKAFMIAVNKGDSHVETVELFLQYRVDVNALYQGETALIAAAYKGHVEIVDRLLNHPTNPADVNKPGGEFGSAIYAAVANPDIPYDHFSKPIITKEDRSRIFDLLLDKGAIVGPIYRQYGTILHTATCYLSEDLAIHVLEKGEGRWSMLDPDWERRTPFHIAAYRDQLKLASVFLESHTISVDSLFSKDMQGRTVVHFAAAGGGLAFLQCLRNIGGQDVVTTPDDDGWTPLHWACRHMFPSNAEWLIQQGASVAARTVEGWTPEDVATYHDNTLVIEYLRREATAEKSLNASGYPFWTPCKSCFTVRIHSWAKDHLLGPPPSEFTFFVLTKISLFAVVDIIARNVLILITA